MASSLTHDLSLIHRRLRTMQDDKFSADDVLDEMDAISFSSDDA
jgi:hypothetical protein